MKSLVLAAGYATRLYPLTKNRPKPLLDMAGRPVLEYVLDRIQGLEAVDRIYIVVNERFFSEFEAWKAGYRSPKPIELLNDGSTDEEDRLGAIGDIRFSIQKANIKEDLLVVAGDNLFDMELTPFIRAAKEKFPHASMMLYDVKDLNLARQYGIVGIDRQGKIISFEEKPKEPESTLSAMGVYLFPKPVLEKLETYLKEGSPQDAPGFFIRWLYQREPVYGHPVDGVWYDIGDLDSYRSASKVFAQTKEEK